MDVTISIDEKVLQSAQELAEKQGTSLNQIIRDFLAKWTSRETANPGLRELEEMWSKDQTSPRKWVWNREELHDRPILS
jgi:hypothetical protein